MSKWHNLEKSSRDLVSAVLKFYLGLVFCWINVSSCFFLVFIVNFLNVSKLELELGLEPVGQQRKKGSNYFCGRLDSNFRKQWLTMSRNLQRKILPEVEIYRSIFYFIFSLLAVLWNSLTTYSVNWIIQGNDRWLRNVQYFFVEDRW